jgi:pyroglutamyl-peptidase
LKSCPFRKLYEITSGAEEELRPVLVTGFEPYGGRGSNPAYDTMRALDGRKIGAADIVGRALPVAIASIKSNIGALLEEISPSAVISLGLWPGEPMIRLERIGVNIADFEIADNEGAICRDIQVSGNGSIARLASLPLRTIEQELLASGIPARLSSTAGTFLCNACLYGFLEAIDRQARYIPCGFIHVPYTPELVAQLVADIRNSQQLEQHQRADLVSMELSRIIRAVEIAIGATLQTIA